MGAAGKGPLQNQTSATVAGRGPRVVGAPGSNPSTEVPFDVSGYRPMLAFIEEVRE